MATKTVETKIDKLVPDNINANKGTEYGQHLVEKSLREFGAGRSIQLTKTTGSLPEIKRSKMRPQLALKK